MVKGFKVVDLIIEVLNVVTAEIVTLSLSDPVDSIHYATPIYTTFLLLEAINDSFIQSLEKTRNSSIAGMYFNNASNDLKDFERVLNKFSIWLSTNQMSSRSSYPVNIREFLQYLVNVDLLSAKGQKQPDFDIRLWQYDDDPQSIQYTDQVLYHFKRLNVALQGSSSILEKAHNSLASMRTIKNISVRARMAVAITCILKETERLSLQHSELNKFIEFFWSFVEQEDLTGWDTNLRAYDKLCEIWDELEDEDFSEEVASIPKHVREMCLYTIELGGQELYGAIRSYSPGTYQQLLEIFRILAYASGEVVELGGFQKSSIDENHGWGFHQYRDWFTTTA